MGNNLSSSCTAVPSAAACRTDHVVALLGGALAASIYHVSCGSIMLWNSAQKHWSPPPHGKMQAVRRWIRSALHPAEHALEASSWGCMALLSRHGGKDFSVVTTAINNPSRRKAAHDHGGVFGRSTNCDTMLGFAGSESDTRIGFAASLRKHTVYTVRTW